MWRCAAVVVVVVVVGVVVVAATHSNPLCLACVQIMRDRVPELDLFSCFLRELYDYDVLLMYLHARAAIKTQRALDAVVGIFTILHA